VHLLYSTSQNYKAIYNDIEGFTQYEELGLDKFNQFMEDPKKLIFPRLCVY